MDVHETLCAAVAHGFRQLALENGARSTHRAAASVERTPPHGLCALHPQALRFYFIIFVGMSTGILGTYLQVTVVPKVLVAVLKKDSKMIGITFLWGGGSFAAVTVVVALTLYLAEMLALDWRKALTRKVRSSCVSWGILAASSECARNQVAVLHGAVAGAHSVLQWKVHVLVEPSGQAY